jgi:hypothetical protein
MGWVKNSNASKICPPSYQRDLCKKLQCLDQGDMSVQDYYAELQKGIIHAGVHEETEDKICHFYGGLRTEIQDIVDYKNTIPLIICSNLLCWQRRNCKADNQQEGRAHSRLVTHRQHLQLRVHLLQLIF